MAFNPTTFINVPEGTTPAEDVADFDAGEANKLGLGIKAAHDDLAAHAADTTGVHGITDTAALETTTGSAAKVTAHAAVTTSVHGITNTAALETTTGSAAKVAAHAAASDPHGDRAYAAGLAAAIMNP